MLDISPGVLRAVDESDLPARPDTYNGSPVKPSQAGTNIVAMYNVDVQADLECIVYTMPIDDTAMAS
jgi:hypothetical protein